jgi:hypothetical protein
VRSDAYLVGYYGELLRGLVARAAILDRWEPTDPDERRELERLRGLLTIAREAVGPDVDHPLTGQHAG